MDASAPTTPSSGSAGTGGSADTALIDAGPLTPVGGDADVLPIPPPGCTEGATRPCGPATVKGVCKLGTRTCKDGAWGECEGAVMPAARDCSSELDNDCDGQPDNLVDDTCRCRAGSAPDPCDTHPGFDGHGPCMAGSRVCVVAADKLTSDWGACSGSVGPIVHDSCTVRGDDSDCDGTPNGGCACIEGEIIACGPPENKGICVRGTSTCTGGKYTACAGATFPAARNCASSLDNDCDGNPDNTVDTACTCLIGTSEPCDTHTNTSGDSIDGVGVCKAGTHTCIAGATPGSSTWGACTGAVAPGPRNCAATGTTDNDCDGVPDNTIDAVCTCAVGTSQACGTHGTSDGHGNCRAGLQLCVAGASNSSSTWGTCTGSVGPAAQDSCTVAGDDANCDGTPNGGCECVGSDSSRCSSASAARCSAGQCTACTSNADCTHLTGLPVCTAGTCVASSTTTGP